MKKLQSFSGLPSFPVKIVCEGLSTETFYFFLFLYSQQRGQMTYIRRSFRLIFLHQIFVKKLIYVKTLPCFPRGRGLSENFVFCLFFFCFPCLMMTWDVSSRLWMVLMKFLENFIKRKWQCRRTNLPNVKQFMQIKKINVEGKT